MKSLAKKAVLQSGVLRSVGRLRGRGAAILMYHSVMVNPQSQETLLGGIAHSEDVFREQMELVARQYRPVSLDQVKGFVQGGDEIPALSVVVSFDDGYADNHEIAAPILNEVGVPAIFYVTVNCVEQRMLPWPARLRFVFRSTRKPTWPDSSGRSWPLANADARERAYLFSCDQCCKLTGAAQESYLAGVEERLETPIPADSAALMMNYDQIRSLAGQGHIVASHTLTHPNMAHVSAEEARREMVDSKLRLEKELKAVVSHFSYPCPALSPHWTEQTVSLSRSAGYETAVTTDGGLARKGDDPLRLKRIRPTKTLKGLEWSLECAFAGRAV
jgi:peptidoglycan/xylan/chitin deacetylase (PgdA/CDA1 family)